RLIEDSVLIALVFGKRTGGSARRPNECFVLEPSEMIVAILRALGGLVVSIRKYAWDSFQLEAIGTAKVFKNTYPPSCVTSKLAAPDGMSLRESGDRYPPSRSRDGRTVTYINIDLSNRK
ncbi:hypothetical protein L9F63_009619, partial [Diploptera punctata]